jgi:nucleoside-diphosphate-sugar epimerase
VATTSSQPSSLSRTFVDVRDLAGWLVESGAGGGCGTYNATGEVVSFGDHLGIAREVAGHHGPLTAVPEEWLLSHGVQPWMGERSLPLWLPMPEYAGFAHRDGSAARAAGLGLRPLEQTLADTLRWALAEGVDRARGAGLTRREEAQLLDELAG